MRRWPVWCRRLAVLREEVVRRASELVAIGAVVLGRRFVRPGRDDGSHAVALGRVLTESAKLSGAEVAIERASPHADPPTSLDGSSPHEEEVQSNAGHDIEGETVAKIIELNG